MCACRDARADDASLKAADQTFKSNLFQLQVTELINAVRIDRAANESKTRKLEEWLHSLKQVLDALPPVEVQGKQGDTVLGVRLHRHSTAVKSPIAFTFLPPRVDLVGR